MAGASESWVVDSVSFANDLSVSDDPLGTGLDSEEGSSLGASDLSVNVGEIGALSDSEFVSSRDASVLLNASGVSEDSLGANSSDLLSPDVSDVSSDDPLLHTGEGILSEVGTVSSDRSVDHAGRSSVSSSHSQKVSLSSGGVSSHGDSVVLVDFSSSVSSDGVHL